jgi:hypothetical protein
MSDYINELPNGYTFVHEGENYNFIIAEPSKKKQQMILPNVQEYKHNDEFIVATQIPNKELYTQFLSDSTSVSSDYHQRILKGKKNYWAIILKKDSLCGPYTHTEYKMFMKKFNIPNDLDLK